MMSRILLNRFIIPFAAALSFAGCSTKGPSRQHLELLTGAPWKYQQAGFNSNEDESFNALDPRIAGCEKDNTVIFRTDGTGILQEGKVKCKLGEPDSLPFSWSFQNNDSTIYFQDQYYRVKELSNTRFAIYADQNFGGILTRYTIVLIH